MKTNGNVKILIPGLFTKSKQIISLATMEQPIHPRHSYLTNLSPLAMAMSVSGQCGCPWVSRTVETSPDLKRRVLDPQSSGEFREFVPFRSSEAERKQAWKRCSCWLMNRLFSYLWFSPTMTCVETPPTCIFFVFLCDLHSKVTIVTWLCKPVRNIWASSREIFSHKSVATSYLTTSYIYIYTCYMHGLVNIQNS